MADRHRWPAAGVLAVALLAPAACSDDADGPGEARLEVDGEAVVERAAGSTDVVTGRTAVGPGDRIEVVDGRAVLAMSAGTRLELRAGHDDAADSVLVVDEVPELEAGDLLVASPEGIEVTAAGTTVSVAGGAAKVTRSLGMGVVAYDGDVVVDSAGQTREVPALRALLVPALGNPQPLRPAACRAPAVTASACPAYDPTDAWDRRFLGDAIDLGQRLESIADAYTSSLAPGEGRTPGFFRLILPGLEDEDEFGPELLDLDRPPGETLVGAAITDLGERGRFADRWRAVFGFRDEGAEWGLVALDQAVSRTPLLGAVTEAVSASPLAFGPTTTTTSTTTVAAPPPPPPAGGGDPTTTAAPPPPPPSTAPPATASPPPPTTAPPAPALPPPLPPDPVSPVLSPIVEPVTDLVGGLLDGLTGLLR